MDSSPTAPMSPSPNIDVDHDKYPYCIVWTPIPLLTWLFPFIGHMGIAMSNGVIRDFAGPYYVSEDDMAFGRPTKYLQLDPMRICRQTDEYSQMWDQCVHEASEVYKSRMHNLFWDNCHSHVAMALNKMKYDEREDWNMVRLAIWITVRSQYVGFGGWLKTWVPFLFIFMCMIVGYHFLL